MYYMSRLGLRHGAAASAGLAAILKDVALEQGAHRLIWTLFGDRDERKRDFLYRETGRAARLSYIVVSARPPEDRHGVWRIETKDYAPELAAGQRLAFSLRANPALRTKRAGQSGSGRGKRVDAVMDAKKARRGQPNGAANGDAALVSCAGFEWLAARAGRCGFSVREKECCIGGYLQHRLPRKKANPVRFSTLDFDGILRVEDPALLVRTLHAGLGPSKAFGCGLLLVKPA